MLLRGFTDAGEWGVGFGFGVIALKGGGGGVLLGLGGWKSRRVYLSVSLR